MRRVVAVISILVAIAATSAAGDLYKVTLNSHRDAETLKALELDVLLWVRGGYLVLADDAKSAELARTDLEIVLIASGVRRNQLAMDGRFDRKNAERFEVLYEDGRVRLLLASADRLALPDQTAEVFPLHDNYIEIAYYPAPTATLPTANPDIPGIDTIMAKVEQDSLEAYVERLQAFYRRLTGTDSSYAARDWIASKFAEFGYESIVIDPFIGSQLPDRVPCQSYNVIAYKPGTVYPNQQIIIGGHFDAAPDCPGADDNASGTAAVLEVARILKNIETNMTLIFIAFDSEESWMWGSYHYADGAVARNDDIVLMINPDMVAHITNDYKANLYYGPETAYAVLWDYLANKWMNIDADMAGSTASDHMPFQEAGYDVIFVQEDRFSTNYHDPTDSTVYMNFEYMTRMVKATLATLYTVDQNLPPVRISVIMEPGDGQSKLVYWNMLNPLAIDHYRLSWYEMGSPGTMMSVYLDPADTSYLVEGLTENVEYAFYVQAYDADGNTSFAYDLAYGTPSTEPASPHSAVARPLRESVRIDWQYEVLELDYDHCAVIRDGEIIAETTDTFYVDDDPSLGIDLHYYYITAVDIEGNHSDTVGIPPVWMKAAMLQPDRILAVNRTSVRTVDFVDETETGAFMREALNGYNFDYYSDTVATIKPDDPVQLDLIDMIDYGVMVIGTEAANYDDIGCSPEENGILDTLAYYMSIGGKVVIFGRWGDLGELGDPETINYGATPVHYDDAYQDWFHIGLRVLTLTVWDYTPVLKYCDLVGAHSNMTGYPDLVWDSVATIAHANSGALTITGAGGIPCATIDLLTDGADPQVLYTYDSRDNDPVSEGAPVAWRYLGEDYSYVYFDIPLSFFEREAAVQALRKAVDDLMNNTSDVEETAETDNLPSSYGLSQNYPNPFNPNTEIVYSLPRRGHVRLSIYNILGQRVRLLVDQTQPAGTHTISWDGTGNDGKSLATGIYFYQMQVGDYRASKKMLLVK